MRLHPDLIIRRASLCICAAAAALWLNVTLAISARAQDPVFVTVDIPGPPGSERFGEFVYGLPNGNFVVVDSLYDAPAVVNVGSVSLYDGVTLQLISRLTGSNIDDKVGSGQIIVLQNGNFVVRSQFWDNGGIVDAGAVTFVNATAGLTGTVTIGNSLVGGSTNDRVGGVDRLSNGNYLVRSSSWRNPVTPATNAGMVALGSGLTGIAGVVSAANALVGTTTNDFVGQGLRVLDNGAYVISSPSWNNGVVVDAGAATWGDGVNPVVGPISSANSLVGSSTADAVGGSITGLSGGNYVVVIQTWDSPQTDAGAVTWGSATSGVKGVVSADNSLVGATAQDRVGSGGVTELSNGNFVVASSQWDAPGVANAGAATWCNGATGCFGAVSTANSLVGPNANDFVSGGGIAELSNGHYVVSSYSWNGNLSDVGAVTWRNGAIASTGIVTFSNSLVGSSADDEISSDGVTALVNGNYVVNSVNWDGPGAVDAGAVTWVNGTGPTSGVVSVANSFVGSQASDYVGENGVIALSNGNYLIRSTLWSNVAIPNAGAITWGSGTGGSAGAVSAANSMVGTTTGELGGSSSIFVLDNGAYIVNVPNWDSLVPPVVDAGAARFNNGASPLVGAIDPANSLVGSKTNDLSSVNFAWLTNGNYVVGVPNWDDGADADAGAAIWGSSSAGRSGVISSANALVGSRPSDRVGNEIIALSNGNYAVHSPDLDLAAFTDIGAVTWGDGAAGSDGVIGLANSMIGTGNGDRIGSGPFTLVNGNIVFLSDMRDNPSNGAADAGAVTLIDGRVQSSGFVTGTNSVLGLAVSGGQQIRVEFNETRQYLIVGRPLDSQVTVAALRWRLNVARNGTGAGVVSSSLPGISCGSDCSNRFNGNLVITLTATSAISSSFTEWAGDCVGTGACAVTMDRTHTVTATFALNTYALTANTAGSGSGAINGLPPNPAVLNYGTVITLTATPASGSTFAGWSGACTGTGACNLTMDGAKEVTATFTPASFALTVNTAGSGSGTLTGIPTNAAAIPYGTLVTLNATPNPGSTFTGWSGDCAGTGACQLNMTQARSATATFATGQFEVTLPAASAGGIVKVEVVTSAEGTEALAVTIQSKGEADAATVEQLNATYPAGTVLTLTAVPNPLYRFVEWGGDLSGSANPQQVTVGGPLAITATFATTKVYLPTVEK